MVGLLCGTGGDADGRERRCLRAPFPYKGEGRFLAVLVMVKQPVVQFRRRS